MIEGSVMHIALLNAEYEREQRAINVVRAYQNTARNCSKYTREYLPSFTFCDDYALRRMCELQESDARLYEAARAAMGLDG